MDGVSTPQKGTPSLSSPKPSAGPNRSLSGSRETNENEQPHEQKPMTKNFMSPTISAASKASISRKKILAERNEISSSCESHPHHKASNLGSKTNSLNSITHRSGKLPVSSHTYASESEDDQENNFAVESSYKPYDPVTNYLAPRPKYLRYKPTRRRGIILSQENLTGNDNVAVISANDNEGPSQQQAHDSSNQLEKCDSKPENEEGDSVDDDEEMDEDVAQEWGFKGLFKILLLLVVFFISGLDLSSMKSIVTSDTCNMIRKNMFEAVFYEIYGSENVYVDQLENSQSGILELSQGGETNYEPEAVKLDEDIVEFLNVETVEIENTADPLKEPRAAVIDIQQDSAEVEVTQDVHGDEEEEAMSEAAGEVAGSNEVNEEEVEGSDEQLQKGQIIEEQEELNQENLKPFNLEELVDDIPSTSANVQCAHSGNNFEQAEADNKVEQVEQVSQESDGGEELSETELKGAEEIDTKFETSNLDTGIESKTDGVQVIGQHKTVIIIGVSAASVLLASLVMIYVSRKPRASIESPQAGMLNTVIAANVKGELLEVRTETSVKVPSLDKPLNDPSKNLRSSHLERTPEMSITQASSLFGSKKEASKEISYSSAPNVELLGEMVVEVSSTLRSCVKKNSITEAEDSNTNFSKGKASQAQPSVQDHPITDSQSYGSFTAEKKILKKKQVEKDGEEIKKVVLTTPVRRSSRIAAMSP